MSNGGCFGENGGSEMASEFCFEAMDISCAFRACTQSMFFLGEVAGTCYGRKWKENSVEENHQGKDSIDSMPKIVTLYLIVSLSPEAALYSKRTHSFPLFLYPNLGDLRR